MKLLRYMFRAGLIDKVFAFVAPKIIGGKNALSPVAGDGFEKLIDAVELENLNTEKIGSDILISGYVR